MAKITINCGQCSKTKCSIKKDFRSLVIEYPKIKYTHDIGFPYEYDPIFKLKCPYKKHKYKNGDKVIVSVGIQRYSKEFKHDCMIDDEFIDCDNCKYGNKCNDGEVTHINIRYAKYIEIEAEIDSYYKGDKYSYKYDFKAIEDKLNERDKEFLQSINQALNNTPDGFKIDKRFANLSKSKFIRLNNY